jgi:hypothetical protein
LGQTLPSRPSAQAAQKVHSKLQMRAWVDAGGSAVAQCSQQGRSSSMVSAARLPEGAERPLAGP